MRYLKTESTYILGAFSSGDSVTISVYRLSDNTKVVNSDSCDEIGTTGKFKYLFSTTVSDKTEFLWVMTNGTEEQCGKIILGGWPNEICDKLPDDFIAGSGDKMSLESKHGSGSWEGTTPEDIDALLSEKHGTGPWTGGGGGGGAGCVWYPQDKEEVLKILGDLSESSSRELQLLGSIQSLVQELRNSVEARAEALGAVVSKIKVPTVNQIRALLSELPEPVTVDQIVEVSRKLDDITQMVVRLLRDEDIDELIGGDDDETIAGGIQ